MMIIIHFLPQEQATKIMQYMGSLTEIWNLNFRRENLETTVASKTSL